MQHLITKWSDAHLRRTYDTSAAHLLVVAPTERELAGLRPNRLGGFGLAELGMRLRKTCAVFSKRVDHKSCSPLDSVERCSRAFTPET